MYQKLAESAKTVYPFNFTAKHRVKITVSKNSAIAEMAAQCCTSRVFAVKRGYISY